MVPRRAHRSVESRRVGHGPRCRRPGATRLSGPTSGWPATQHADGGWHAYYLGHDNTIEDATPRHQRHLYVAAGVWHHYLVTGDRAYLRRLWPMVGQGHRLRAPSAAPGGEVLWAYDYDGEPERYALLTGSSWISLRCGAPLAIADVSATNGPTGSGRRPPRLGRRPPSRHVLRTRTAGRWTGTTRCSAACSAAAAAGRAWTAVGRRS